MAGGLALASLGATLAAGAASGASWPNDRGLGPRGGVVARIDHNKEIIAMQLRQRGYNVESVQGWGGCVKAFITDPGGGSHMAFFDPDTLEPLTY
jgi:hypothetical protein